MYGGVVDSRDTVFLGVEMILLVFILFSVLLTSMSVESEFGRNWTIRDFVVFGVPMTVTIAFGFAMWYTVPEFSWF